MPVGVVYGFGVVAFGKRREGFAELAVFGGGVVGRLKKTEENRRRFVVDFFYSPV